MQMLVFTLIISDPDSSSLSFWVRDGMEQTTTRRPLPTAAALAAAGGDLVLYSRAFN
jgi:hypothetical protein